MKYTIEQLKEMMDDNGGSLNLSGTPITSLPDNLTVGGWLNLRGTPITSLPDNLTVGEWLDLSGAPITSLPDNLTVGGSLDLSGTPITSLPDNLTVGGSLNLSGTPITSLPDNLTVGGWIDLRKTPIESKEEEAKKIKRLKNGDYVEGRYLYCDDTLIHVNRKRKIGEYTYYVGKIKGMNAIYDGGNYAHCKDFRDGVNDLEFKKAKDRGASQYRDYTMDTVVPFEDAKTMYRIITGSCKAGTEQFVNGLQSVKEQYTVREIIDITKNAYRGEVFKSFFEKKEN